MQKPYDSLGDALGSVVSVRGLENDETKRDMFMSLSDYLKNLKTPIGSNKSCVVGSSFKVNESFPQFFEMQQEGIVESVSCMTRVSTSSKLKEWIDDQLLLFEDRKRWDTDGVLELGDITETLQCMSELYNEL